MTLVLWNFAILTDTQKKIQKGLTGMEAFNRIQRLAHAGEESELFSASYSVQRYSDFVQIL